MAAPTPQARLALTRLEQSSLPHGEPQQARATGQSVERMECASAEQEEEEEEDEALRRTDVERHPLSVSRHEFLSKVAHRANATMQRSILDTSVWFDPSDPFDEQVVARSLRRLRTPIHQAPNYHRIAGSMPTVHVNSTIQIGVCAFEINVVHCTCR